MCVKMSVPGYAAALGVAVFLLVPNEAAAKPNGAKWGAPGLFKGKTAPFMKPHVQADRGAFRRPWFGGLYAGYAPYYFPASYMPVVGDAPPPERLDPYLPPPQNLICQRSREAVTVPSEYGGERTINITRC
jgi:hypothetical protein